MADRIGYEFYLRARDLTDKLAFLGFAVAGVIWIVIAESLPVWQPVVTGLLVLAILAYVVVALRLGRLKLRPDQVGDNCYYLGFTFTLGSLAYSLYRFTSDEAGVQLLLANLGIALFTTGAGILLRVVLHQMRMDPADIEQESRIALSEAALRLRGELDEMSLSMNSFRAATQQSIAEAFDEIGSKVLNVIARATTSLESATASFGTVTSTAIERINLAFNTFSGDAQTLTKSSRRLVTSIDQLIERIGNIEAPTDLILSRLEPVIGKMSELTATLQQQINGAERRAKKSDAMLENIAPIAQQIPSIADSVRTAADGLRVATANLSGIGAELERLKSGINGAVDVLRRLESVGDLTVASATAKTAVEKMVDDLRSASGAITQEGEVIRVEVDRSRAAQSVFIGSVAQLAATVDRLAGTISAGQHGNGPARRDEPERAERPSGWNIWPFGNR